METTTNSRQIEGLSEQEEKAVALMLHLGNDFFVCDAILYAGTEEDAKKDYKAELKTLTKTTPKPTFEEWVADNCEAIDIDALVDENYKVLTDNEADEENDAMIDNYIEECILPEIPSQYRSYFDSEAFKNDAAHDGRGHNIALYDGHENEEEVNGTTYYIYRIG